MNTCRWALSILQAKLLHISEKDPRSDQLILIMNESFEILGQRKN